MRQENETTYGNKKHLVVITIDKIHNICKKILKITLYKH